MKDKPAPHISIAPHSGRVRVLFAGETVADSSGALVLREGRYPPVLYIPRADANMRLYRRTAHSTHCPHKGDAVYFSLSVGERNAENAVWTYESPFAGVEQIKDHLAFYPDRVDRIEALLTAAEAGSTSPKGRKMNEHRSDLDNAALADRCRPRLQRRHQTDDRHQPLHHAGQPAGHPGGGAAHRR